MTQATKLMNVAWRLGLATLLLGFVNCGDDPVPAERPAPAGP